MVVMLMVMVAVMVVVMVDIMRDKIATEDTAGEKWGMVTKFIR